MITRLGVSRIELPCFLQVVPSIDSSYGTFCFAVMRSSGSCHCLKSQSHSSFFPHFPQDEQSAMLMLKRHMILKQAVDDYAGAIRKLSDRAQRMFTEDHPNGFVLVTSNVHI